MLDTYDSALTAMRTRYNTGIGQRDLLQQQLNDVQAELLQAKQDIVTWEQTQLLLGKVSDYARTQILERIQNTVSAALYAVFGEGYEFRINMRTVGNQAAAEWQVVSQYGDTEVVCSPEDSRGGGIVDVVSLALRLAMLELLRPRVDGPLILDEPAKMVSQTYLPNVAYFLKQYARQTGRQILLVTHADSLAEVADRSYLVTQKDGISEVKQLS
jgi:DNA repair exonuclease SbcCD ATPase subunit